MIAEIRAPETVFWLSACGLFVLSSGFFSGAEIGLYCVNRLRIRLAAHGGDRRATIVDRFLDRQADMLFVTLLGTNASNYLAPMALTAMLLHAGRTGGEAEFYATLILTPVVFILGEVVPKNLFQRHAERFMLRSARLLAASDRVFSWTGLVRLQRWVSDRAARRWRRQPGEGSVFQARIEMYNILREGAAHGALTATQSQMLERVHALRSIAVRSVMIPRGGVVTLRADMTRRDVARIAADLKHSRLPVWRDDARRIVGTVHILDILAGPEDVTVAARMLPPVEIRYDVSVLDALSVLQRAHRRIAVVTDTRGACLGIVTVKDLVEEIVGDLAAW